MPVRTFEREAKWPYVSSDLDRLLGYQPGSGLEKAFRRLSQAFVNNQLTLFRPRLAHHPLVSPLLRAVKKLVSITDCVIFIGIMTGAELRKVRQEAGWTQGRLAKRLRVTQAYLSLMEGEKRRVPDRVKRQMTALFGLPPTYLPLSASPRPTDPAKVDVELEQGLARLGYPGLAYRKRPGPRRNPVDLLLMALSVDDLDARLAEALPWLLLRFKGYDTEQLVAQAKSLDLQNRLGFTVALARRVADQNPLFRDRLDELQRLEQQLEPSRLAREDTYGRRESSERMRAWMREQRTPEAQHWNLLSDLKAEHLPYAGPNPGAMVQFPAGR